MTTTTNITILAESKKGALLITDGNTVTWIMAKMRRADGSFTPGALKALAESDVTVADHEAQQEAFKNPNQDIKVVKETEKAVAIEAYTSWYCHVREESQTRTTLVWIPKSMLVNGQAPKWFVKKKVDELTYQDGSGFHFFYLS